jgi:hypothetical protein
MSATNHAVDPAAATRPSRDWQQRLSEAFDMLYQDLVDPRDRWYDEDGRRWIELASTAGADLAGRGLLPTPEQLAEIRADCRALAVSNEFAINGHENRISYIVGSGHAYRVIEKEGRQVPELPLAQAQRVLDGFLERNRWHQRQQEIVRRRDRDGEVFLRFFIDAAGELLVRFVEPDQVACPPHRADDPAASCGVVTDPDDVETVLGYLIDGREVDAGEIQHRKANVDTNVKRGLPLFYPVRKNLRRAEKLLRNMSVLAEIQSAIALIRKHASGSRDSISQFVADGADAARTDPTTGRTSHYRRYEPGTILDAFAGTSYEFPAAAVDAGRYVAVLQAELRAIASRLVMPEFMLSSDASNANYASTMVAEGPAVKMFQRLQHEMIEDDLQVMRRVLETGVATGRLPAELIDDLEIQAEPPSLATRDRLREAQADQILVRNGAMSRHTMAARNGLNPQREWQLIERRCRTTPSDGAGASNNDGPNSQGTR